MHYQRAIQLEGLNFTDKEIELSFGGDMHAIAINQTTSCGEEVLFSVWKAWGNMEFHQMDKLNQVIKEQVEGKVEFEKDTVEKAIIRALAQDFVPPVAEYLEFLKLSLEIVEKISVVRFDQALYEESCSEYIKEIQDFENSYIVNVLGVDASEISAIKNKMIKIADYVPRIQEVCKQFKKIIEKVGDLPKNEDTENMKDVLSHNYDILILLSVSKAEEIPEQINLNKENINKLLTKKADDYVQLFDFLK